MQEEQAARHNETYNAIIAAYKMMQHNISKMLLEEGLTLPQFQALKIVAKCGATPMKIISEGMLVTPANITGIIDRLESGGLIKRKVRQGDRRTTIIELTLKGRELQERVATRYSGFVQKALRMFTIEEQSRLRELLAKFQEGMSQSRG
jgi:DNA-binding MarR family transcriptional regulator